MFEKKKVGYKDVIDFLEKKKEIIKKKEDEFRLQKKEFEVN